MSRRLFALLGMSLGVTGSIGCDAELGAQSANTFQSGVAPLQRVTKIEALRRLAQADNFLRVSYTLNDPSKNVSTIVEHPADRDQRFSLAVTVQGVMRGVWSLPLENLPTSASSPDEDGQIKLSYADGTCQYVAVWSREIPGDARAESFWHHAAVFDPTYYRNCEAGSVSSLTPDTDSLPEDAWHEPAGRKDADDWGEPADKYYQPNQIDVEFAGIDLGEALYWYSRGVRTFKPSSGLDRTLLTLTRLDDGRYLFSKLGPASVYTTSTSTVTSTWVGSLDNGDPTRVDQLSTTIFRLQYGNPTCTLMTLRDGGVWVNDEACKREGPGQGEMY